MSWFIQVKQIYITTIIILVQAIIIGVILCLGHIAGGVVSAFYAEGLSEVGGLVRNGLAASAVSLAERVKAGSKAVKLEGVGGGGV